MTNTEYQQTRIRLRELVDTAYENGDMAESEYELAMEYIENADVRVSENKSD